MDEYQFPHPNQSDRQGLLAIGGDLAPARLLKAYSQGIFPWFEPGCPILWWSPNPRLIFKPNQFKTSRSLQKSLNKPHRFTIDTAFEAVITACAAIPGRVNNTWLTPDMQSAYCQLHQQGYAHSFEIWQENELVGGLYGISLGRAFFGESMFHYQRDASKMALFYLCQTLCAWNFDFIDCQLPTAHLLSLGAVTISRKEFLHHLHQSLKYPTCVGNWQLNDCHFS